MSGYRTYTDTDRLFTVDDFDAEKFSMEYLKKSLTSPGSFSNFYRKLDVMGEGSFGSVIRVHSQSSTNTYAMKEIKTALTLETYHELQDVITDLKRLKHDNLIRFEFLVMYLIQDQFYETIL